MRNRKAAFFIGFLSLAVFYVLLSCATDQASLKIENSLPQSELAYYNDSFDKIREDLWSRAGFLYRDEQMQNFKLADMRFEKGKLVIRTKTGSFSKGGLGTKYVFRGDFDIQLNFRMDFLKSMYGMDQLLNFIVLDKSGKLGKADVVVINLSMEAGSSQGWLGSGALIKRRWIDGGSKKTKNFKGSFRCLRKGKKITALYKKDGAPDWSRLYSFRVTDKDMMAGFQVRNFFNKRTSIQATQSISVEFDNFRINAAQEIIEEEI